MAQKYINEQYLCLTPVTPKPLVDYARMALMDPRARRACLSDGCYGGHYQLPENVTDRLWAIAVDETRAALEGPWLDPA